MKLKYTIEIQEKKIFIVAETIDFTPEEEKLLNDLGEPVIEFKEQYELLYDVEFNRKIKTGFKIAVNFDGSVDLVKANTAALQFIDDLQQALSDAMAKLKNEAAKLIITEKKDEIIEILY